MTLQISTNCDYESMVTIEPKIGAARVVKLNKVDSGTPFYCLCGLLLYKPFAEHFSQYPVYGMYADAEVTNLNQWNPQNNKLVSFDKLTDSYVAGIKKHANGNKLKIAGLSFGGIVALEVEKKLRAEGYEVEDVILFDTYVPSLSHRRSAMKFYKDLRNNLQTLGITGTVKDLTERTRGKLFPKTKKPRLSNAQIKLRKTTAYFRIVKAYLSSNLQQNYDTNVLLIKSERFDMGFGLVPKDDYGLSRITSGKIETEGVDADHNGAVQGPASIETYNKVIGYINRQHIQQS
jgi:thioesterase domain-containing protein